MAIFFVQMLRDALSFILKDLVQFSPYLHSVGFPGACLSIGEDTDIITVNTGRDQRLNLIEYLKVMTGGS